MKCVICNDDYWKNVSNGRIQCQNCYWSERNTELKALMDRQRNELWDLFIKGNYYRTNPEIKAMMNRQSKEIEAFMVKLRAEK